MDQTTQRPWYRRLEVIAPAVMVVFGTLDIALRFTPIEWVAFRAWEVVTDHPGRWAPFAALKTYRNPHAYGDLSNAGNLPSRREYHEEVFTTDEYGFRNPPQKEDARVPRALLVGTSFSAGCGLSDDETLSARLSARTKCRVYNAAGPWDYCNCAHRAISRLKMHQGVVIYEFAERNNQPQDMLYCLDALEVGYWFPTNEVLSGRFEKPPGHALAARADRITFWREAWAKSMRGHIPESRLEIIGVKLYKLLQNDRILPNTLAKATVTDRVLCNGDVLLFPEDQPRLLLHLPDPWWVAPYCSWFTKEMRRNNLGLIVVLVPEKFTVYRPFFSPPETAQDVSPEYLDQVEGLLKQAGISVVNLLPVFRQAAFDGLASHRYIYRRDDTHWNGRGVEIAAEHIPFTCPSPLIWE